MEIKIKLDSPIYGEFKVAFSCSEREVALLMADADFHKVMKTISDDLENHQIKKVIDDLNKKTKPWPKEKL